ncbi:hypothetical protein [Paenibacillus sp. FSL R7-0128]|uniref:hypothetical protein n=1 Tax=Paenibacillus sp. FSL R7-0128 TaxID=2954529 RepID=UPI0030FC63DC
MTTQIKVGNTVKWTSQSQGSTKTKQGIVHAIVPSDYNAMTFLPIGLKLAQIKFDTWYTKFERFIIAVPRGGKSQIVDYYCPRPTMLRLGEEGDNQ